MRKYIKAYAYLFVVAAAVVALDQWTKLLVRNNLEFGEMWSPWEFLAPYARILHWQNTGAVFGIFQNFGNVFSVLAVIVTIAIIYYFPQVPKEDWPLRIAMGLQMGGALGNLIDRIIFGHVTDFISLFNFAVFNVADASISTGVAVLVLGVWVRERKNKPPHHPEQEANPPAQDPAKNPLAEE